MASRINLALCEAHTSDTGADAGSVVEEAIRDAHVLYVTRVQKEQFDNLEDYDAVKVSTTTVVIVSLIFYISCYYSMEFSSYCEGLVL